MAWTLAQVDQFKAGLDRDQKRKWVGIANSVLETCRKEGGKNCEARAVRIANSKFENAFNPLIRSKSIREGLRKMATEKTQAELESEKKFADLGTIEEMEIFRAGTHNGDDFTEDDLDEIAENFRALKDEVRPKLKLTHREGQKTLAGLASYGDIIDVFTKKGADGLRRLFARIANVPRQVIDLIRERRFPERSIEIYPQFRLGTKESPVYRNVLKAIALLGHEMPAVTGMEPIKLSEDMEKNAFVCFGEVCFPCAEEAQKYQETLVSASIMADMLSKKLK